MEPTVDNLDEAQENVNSVITGIMKQSTNMKEPKSTKQAADGTDPSSPGHASESKPVVISRSTEPETSVVGSSVPPSSYSTPRAICWSKTIEVIYFQEPQAQSTYSLHEYFASRPRQETVKDDKPVVSDEEEVPGEGSQEDQE